MRLAIVALLLVTGCLAGVYKSTSQPGIYQTKADEMTGAVWVKPYLADTPGAGYYLYYGAQDGKKQPMRAVFETWNQDWVFAQTVLIKADDKLFTVDIPIAEWEHTVVPGTYLGSGVSTPTFCAERADVPLGSTHPEVIAALCSAKTVIVRFSGKHAEKTLSSSADNPVFLTVTQQVCKSYEAAGAR